MAHAKKDISFVPLGHVVLRTPLLPLATLDALATSDKTAARRALVSLVERPLVREAIALAAPGLESDLSIWQQSPDSERGQKIERALMSYVQRMAGRCTPFGLFAGVSLGQVGRQQTLALLSHDHYRRKSRLDMGVLYALCEKLLTRREVRRQCRYHPNETLLTVGEQLHFTKGRQEKEARRYELAQAEISDTLGKVFAFTQAGKSSQELIDYLCQDDPSLDVAEVNQFVDQLIDEQLLQSDLAPLITGREASIELAEQLSNMACAEDAAVALQAVNRQLATIDRSPLGNAPSFAAITEALLPFALETKPGQLVQTDLYKPAESVTISQGLVQELLKATRLLTAVFRPEDPLEKTRKAFTARYEGGEVPLLEALDEEVGIGFAEKGGGDGPLLQDIVLGGEHNESSTHSPARERWLSDVASRAVNGEAVIQESELESLGDGLGLCESFSLMAELLGDGSSKETPKAILCGASGPSSENLNGRFAWLDEQLASSVKRSLTAEEALRPEAYFVEIVHSPQGRVGNVIARPSLRKGELPILARSGSPAEQQVALKDLTLRLVDGRFVLRSKKDGREIVPRMANAHAIRGNLPLYRFLALLQGEGARSGYIWNWGRLASAPALPRVRLGNLIVSEARWNLGKTTLAGLKTVEDFLALARDRRWPRFLRCHQADNTLPIDCESPLSIMTFIATYGKRETIMLSEDLQRIFGSPVHGPEGRFANEVLISFRAEERLVPALEKSEFMNEAGSTWRSAKLANGDGATDRFDRVLYPGDDCLYACIYAEPASGDQLLSFVVAPLIAWAKESGSLAQWFFIRYADPDNHLRLRCFGPKHWLQAELLPELRRRLEEAATLGYLNRLELSTYTREIERYGGAPAMALCERWFEADSDAILALLEVTDDLDLRWQYGLAAMHDALKALGFAPAEQLNHITRFRAGLMREFDRRENKGATEDSLAKKFRGERNKVSEILERKAESLAPLLPILAERKAALADIGGRLIELAKRGQLQSPLEDITSSLLHMDANRVFRNGQRAQEFILYDFLSRALRSQVARNSH